MLYTPLPRTISRMESNSSPLCKRIRYSYLLRCENGSFLPLIAVDDLPSTATVLPPLNFVDNITFVQEIPWPRPSSSLGAPETDFLAGNGKTKATVTTTEEETACSSVFQASSSSCSPPAPSSMVGRIRDAVQTRIVFPNVLSPSPGTLGGGAAFALSSSKSGMLYASPPHPKEQTTAPGPAGHARPPTPTRGSLVNGSKPCPTLLSPGTCFWDAACTFRHDLPVAESSSLFVTSDIGGDDSAEEDSAASTTETLYSSIEEEGDGSGDGTGKGEKLRSTEPCAYFHRRVGCKRGKGCFYAHGKDGSTSVAGDKHVPIQKATPLTASNKKLEGEWRRPGPQSPTINSESNREVAVTGEVAIDKKVRILPPPPPLPLSYCIPHGPQHARAICSSHGPAFLSIKETANASQTHFSKITWPAAPGRAPSAAAVADPARNKTHCTFFLRFGECDYWPSCRFSHERPEGTDKWRGNKQTAKEDGTGRKSTSSPPPEAAPQSFGARKRKEIAEGQLILLD